VFADATSDNDEAAGSISCSRADSYQSAASTDGQEASSAPPPDAEPSSTGSAGPGPSQACTQPQGQDTAEEASSTKRLQEQVEQQQSVSLLDALGIPSPVAPGPHPPGLLPTATSSTGPAAQAQPPTQLGPGSSRESGSPLPGPPGGAPPPPLSPPAPQASVTLGDWPSMGLPAPEGGSSSGGGALQAPSVQQDAVPVESAGTIQASSLAAAAPAGMLEGTHPGPSTSPPPTAREAGASAPPAAESGPVDQGAGATSSSPQVINR
jgi:hypothetical protein